MPKVGIVAWLLYPLDMAVFEKSQPTLGFGFDLLGLELVQLQQPDPAMVERTTPPRIAQAEVVGVLRQLAQHLLTQQPDSGGWLEAATVLAACQLGSVEICPRIEDAGEQIR